ncbi:hypothetical protein CPB86DRAFT_603329 [Serendipita vermifera]|nr:hypothetical protein CPB86DRAFT_603329 [Serendipita vermifera]
MSSLIPRQSTDNGTNVATCVTATWQNNYRGETSCQLWTKLGSLCSSNFTVKPLNPAMHEMYPPAVDNECQCNLIAYNLMAACTWCQAGAYDGQWLSIDEWKAPCLNNTYKSYISNSKLTANLSLPGWTDTQPPGSSNNSWNPSSASHEAYLDSPECCGDRGSSLVWAMVIGGPCLGILLFFIYCCVLFAFLARQRERKPWYRKTTAYHDFLELHPMSPQEQTMTANQAHLDGSGEQNFPWQHSTITLVPPSSTVPKSESASHHASRSQSPSKSIDTGDDATQKQEYGDTHVTSPVKYWYPPIQQATSNDVDNADSALPYLPSSHAQKTAEEWHRSELDQKSKENAMTETEDKNYYHAI